MNNNILVALSVTLLCFTPMIAHADVTSNPTETGTLGGNLSSAFDVSNDGTVVTGYSKLADNTTSHAFRWTAETGMVDIGTLGGTNSYAFSNSGDGNAVVGQANIAGDAATHAFRWTQATGMIDLGGIGGTGSYASSVSSDGSVVVGHAQTAGDVSKHAFRWTQETGMVDMGTLGGTYSYSNGVSADGLVISGNAQIAGNSSYNVFRWTEATGMVDIGTLGGNDSNASAISADGAVIAGNSKIDGSSTYHIFRWTQETGMVDLGTLGGTTGFSTEMSADGAIIVGYSKIAGDTINHAFRWTQEAGMQDFNAVLSDANIDMTNITLITAQGISADGKYIVGYGTFSSVENQAYIACYDLASGCVGITTAALQESSVIELTQTQQQTMVGSRSASNTLMGMAQPVMSVSTMTSEATMGSAMASQNGQFVIDDEWTLLGGIAFGSNEYDNVERKNAYLFAGGVRYNLDRHVDLGNEKLSPYVEIGGWYSPDADMSITRSYANGGGRGQGKGTTSSAQWSEYIKFGIVWDKSSDEQINTWIDVGHQAMSFGGYTERSTLGNPFPATISSGTIQMGVARMGASYTIDVEQLAAKAMGNTLPASITFAGAVAQSFGTSSDLKTNVAGAGSVNATPQNQTWGEFAIRMETNLSEDWSLTTSVSGTVSANSTSLHGGAGISYKF